MLSLPIIALFLTLFQPTHQVTYACNATISCGCSAQSAIVTKIVGGENAGENTWGWMVSLLLNETGLCGGTILSSSWVLTAAHCVYNLSPSQVVVSAATNQLLGRKQTSYASSIIVHSGYNSQTVINDIALIKVSTPFNMTDSAIAKICLPAATNGDYPPTNSTVCIHLSSILIYFS
jgi:secreted trypsin-like serine protease